MIQLKEKSNQLRRTRTKLEALESEGVAWIVKDVLQKTHGAAATNDWVEHIIKLMKDDYKRFIEANSPKDLQQKELFD